MIRMAGFPFCLMLAACGAPDRAMHAPSGGYQLAFAQPSPQANYLAVTPGRPGAALPDAQQILSPDFSTYLRRATGCVRDEFRRASVMGSHRVPAGYMIPVVCP